MTGTVEDEAALVAALRDGDEAMFADLVDRYTPSLLRVARGYVPSHEIAEEVVQEAWIALLKGISKFEGRSSLRTWLFTVMINIAKARGIRERRSVDAEIAAYTGGTVDPSRFRPLDDRWPGHWTDEATAARTTCSSSASPSRPWEASRTTQSTRPTGPNCSTPSATGVESRPRPRCTSSTGRHHVMTPP